jgi:hypothetical protein
VVAVIRSLGPVPNDPAAIVDAEYASLHPGQQFEETVICTPQYCAPPLHKFVVGETLAYWGLGSSGDGLKAVPLARSSSCEGNTFHTQPGYSATLTQLSPTTYRSTLSRPATTVVLTCKARSFTWRTPSYVVDRTITKLP